MVYSERLNERGEIQEIIPPLTMGGSKTSVLIPLFH